MISAFLKSEFGLLRKRSFGTRTKIFQKQLSGGFCMQQNIFVIFLVVIVLSFIGGCHQVNYSNALPATENESVTNNSISMANNNKNGTLRSKLYEQKGENLNVEVWYPQIVNSEIIATEKINELIKEAAIDNYSEQWNLEGLTLEQKYLIEKHDEELLSIVFYRYSYVAGTAHPTDTCHAVTINLRTAEEFVLSDFIKSYGYLEDKIAEGKYEVLYGGLKTFTADEILHFYRTSIENVPIEQNLHKFYIAKDGGVCIIFDLPKAGGNYSILWVYN